MKKVLLAMVLVVMTHFASNAQDCWTCKPEKYERVLGSISTSFSASFHYRTDPNRYNNGYSSQELYNILINKAKQEYPYHSNLMIREANIEWVGQCSGDCDYNTWSYNGTFSVVEEDTKAKTEISAREKLYQSVTKALVNIPNGARMAIDKISVPYSLSSDDFKDQLLDILIDKGYRVVAKEYLQKLYQEQQDQLNSGLYNPDTTVEGSKFSAVGYFINVKVTETSIRVQVVNVSTGEYEGNATVNF